MKDLILTISAIALAIGLLISMIMMLLSPPNTENVAENKFDADTRLVNTTLEAVKKKGFIQCGVNTGAPGFSSLDDNGHWTGFDVEFCQSVAAAIFGDANQVKYTPLTAKERFTALQSGEIDLLSRNTTWTLTRDTAMGFNFAGISYYDGQGFMLNKELGITTLLELDGATVCTVTGTTTELNMADYFREHKMEYTPVVFDTSDQAIRGFEAGRCDVLTDDQSALQGLRLKLAKPDSVIMLPEIISKEPLGPVVRQGDDEWFNVIKWVLFALINAEEMGVTSKNVDALKKSSTNPGIKRLLGKEGDMGLGLSNDWAYHVIKQVGNYAEIFERNVGMESPFKIERGLNALWSQGGIQYAPPIR